MMRPYRGPRVAGILLGTILLLAADAALLPAQAPPRLPVPEASARRDALKQVRDLYGERFQEARTPDAKLALVRDMIELAQQTADDPAGRYVLLRVARDIAVQVGDVPATLLAIDRIGSHYEVDVLQGKAAMLRKLAAARQTADRASIVQHRIAEAAALLLEEAARQDRFKTAVALAEVARSAAKGAGDKALAQRVAALVEDMEKQRAEYVEVHQALAVLKDRPNHPGANLVVGRYRCLVKRDWSGGLGCLALGSDAGLKTLAARDLAGPAEPGEQVALADGWWDQAQKAAEAEKPALLSRARHWYEQALGKLTGLARLKVQKRLEQINQAVPPEPGQSGGASGFAARNPAARAALLAAHGGNKLTEAAVEGGLEWLARQQRRDGSWSLLDPYTGGAATNQDNPEAATGLALLAFQGAGNTPAAGKHQKNVAAGWKWLLKQQEGTGDFFHEGLHPHPFYTQGICTAALCELYGTTRDPKYKEPAQRAVKYCLDSQAPEGGWRYQPRLESDVSVTGWMTTALHTARLAGLDVPEANLRRVGRFLDRSSPDDGIRYFYQRGKEPTLAMTAEALLCRLYLGWPRGDKRVTAGVEWITRDENLIEFSRKRNTYYWYYATRLCRSVGGEPWKRWNAVMRQELTLHQVKGGRREAGSWDPSLNDPFEAHGGRLYTTCLCIYMLQEYYRHLPLPKKAGP